MRNLTEMRNYPDRNTLEVKLQFVLSFAGIQFIAYYAKNCSH